MKKLIEITMRAYKTFYVEAESEEDALNSDIVDDESSTTFSSDFDWEHDETDAREVVGEYADYVRKNQSKLIAKEDE